MELKQYWNVIRKRLWLILLLVITASLATGIYSLYFIKPQFEASTKLIVNQTSSPNDLLTKLDLSTINSNIQLVKTYKEIIKTPRIMDKVVEQYPELGLTARELVEKVSVSSVNDTQVMSVTAKDNSYERATSIANAVSSVFQQEIPTLMKVDNVSILNKADASAPTAPVSPNIKLNLAVAFLMSLMAGLGLSFLLEYLDDTVKTEEDIRNVLGLPTLSVIPKIRENDLVKQGRKQTGQHLRREGNVTVET
ncbi:YveK family protein [Paenibacillus sp. GCM10012307]|uniref:Lipopolysaccharide biosynthesis protein n=1 Tax=Paenibacillus roseus TaxID=2798579 RepID=A0A934J2R4_9BACL|nr:Wzz/FepE/Etk N-terminal domain-containing protein [Paenibacillus roseus]MBJ6359781.1 lipopolysaccharide biosynthesis protein [Paenibacillus roseus]